MMPNPAAMAATAGALRDRPAGQGDQRRGAQGDPSQGDGRPGGNGLEGAEHQLQPVHAHDHAGAVDQVPGQGLEGHAGRGERQAGRDGRRPASAATTGSLAAPKAGRAAASSATTTAKVTTYFNATATTEN